MTGQSGLLLPDGCRPDGIMVKIHQAQDLVRGPHH